MIDRAAPLRAAMLQLAEASALYTPLGAGEALIESERCVLFFGNADHEGANSVQRLRLRAAEVEATLLQVRAAARERHCRALTWEIASAAEPTDLEARLLAFGLRPAQPPSAVVMGVCTAVPAAPSDLQVRRVASVDDFKAHVSVTHAAFDAMERLPAELARIEREGQHDLDQPAFVRYNALVEGIDGMHLDHALGQIDPPTRTA